MNIRHPYHRSRAWHYAFGAIIFALSGSMIAFGGFGSGIVGAGIPLAEAATGAPQDGANISPLSPTDFSSISFDQSLANLAATGANYVTLDVPLYQTNTATTDVQDGAATPTLQSLSSAIQYAHSLGLHVMLKFNLYSEDGTWSAYIDPTNRTQWFANYQSTITPFIQLAQANGVEEICIGNELIDMSTPDANSTNTANWLALIAAVRAMYSGKLTYGANWGGPGWTDEADAIQFWSALDYIGISAYYNLSGDGSVPPLVQSWAYINGNTIQPLSSKWGKPVLFTEVGYQAIQDSYTDPWNWGETGAPDEAQQANDYQALYEYWDSQPDYAGSMIWQWMSDPNAGGANDSGYTPQNKTAQSVMQEYFTQGGPAPAPSFSARASYSPQPPVPGENVTFIASVANAGGAISNANVDMEIYNSSGAQVFQQIFSGATLGASSTQNYAFNWTAGDVGSYVLKVGVFSADWSTEYYWGNQVEPITVENGQLTNPPTNTTSTSSSGGGTDNGGGNTSSTVTTSTSTPSSTTGTPATAGDAINVWWPTNGATVNGVQPFKAMIPDTDVDSYTMYWQVDGGQLNPMADNDTDYPHKEASVDVDPWTWRGNGPYVVNFIAEDANGNVIATATSTIYN